MTAPTAPTPRATVTLPRHVALGVGAAALVAIGALAGALVMKAGPAAEPGGLSSAPAAAQTAAAPQSLTTLPPSDATAASSTAARPDKPAPVQSSAHRAGDSGAHPAGTPRSAATPLDTQRAAMGPAACATCGVVESVAAVVQKGEGTGVGAVAGSVLGGVLGHQIGGGNGRKAMTVIGAVGGGLAGHEIEKRQRSTTSYRVKVRMDDGSLRTVNRSEPIASGTRVTVDGNALHVRQAAPADAARAMHTGGQQS